MTRQEAINENCKRWKQANKDKVSAYAKEWRRMFYEQNGYSYSTELRRRKQAKQDIQVPAIIV